MAFEEKGKTMVPKLFGSGVCVAILGKSLPRSKVGGKEWRSLYADRTIAPAIFQGPPRP